MSGVATILTAAGHGGADPGASNPFHPGRPEKVITLEIDEEFSRLARAAGHSVARMRTADVSWSPGAIPDRVRSVKAEIVIEFHVNSSPVPPSTPGVEVWAFPTTASEALARAVARRVSTEAGMANRGVKLAYPGWGPYERMRELRDRFYVLSENGFINHPGDEAKLRDPRVIRAIAYGHLAAIHEHFGWSMPPHPGLRVPWLLVAAGAAVVAAVPLALKGKRES